MLRATLVLVAAVAGNHIELTWNDCSSAASHGKITTLVTNPDPLPLGDKGHVTATGTLDETLDDATYNIKVVLLDQTVVDNTHSICEANSFDIQVLGITVGHVDIQALACPVVGGTITVDMDLQLTKLVPPGVAGATISLTATDSNSEELVCLALDAQIVADAEGSDFDESDISALAAGMLTV